MVAHFFYVPLVVVLGIATAISLTSVSIDDGSYDVQLLRWLRSRLYGRVFFFFGVVNLLIALALLLVWGYLQGVGTPWLYGGLFGLVFLYMRFFLLYLCYNYVYNRGSTSALLLLFLDSEIPASLKTVFK